MYTPDFYDRQKQKGVKKRGDKWWTLNMLQNITDAEMCSVAPVHFFNTDMQISLTLHSLVTRHPVHHTHAIVWKVFQVWQHTNSLFVEFRLVHRLAHIRSTIVDPLDEIHVSSALLFWSGFLGCVWAAARITVTFPFRMLVRLLWIIRHFGQLPYACWTKSWFCKSFDASSIKQPSYRKKFWTIQLHSSSAVTKRYFLPDTVGGTQEWCKQDLLYAVQEFKTCNKHAGKYEQVLHR